MTTTKLAQAITEIEKSLITARNFAAAFEHLIPDELDLSFSISNSVILTVDLDYTTDEVRDQTLSLVGKVFGRDGWKAKMQSYSPKFYDWSKTVSGVKLFISGAQKLDVQQEFNVPPNAFPLLLTDSAVAA